MNRKKNIALLVLLNLFFCVASFSQVIFDSTVTENIFTARSETDTTEQFQYRRVAQSTIDSLKKLDAFWYADSAFNSTRPIVSSSRSANRSGSRGSGSSTTKEYSFERKTWLDTKAFLIILLLALAVIVFLLVKNNVVGRKRTHANYQGELVDESENIFEINYQKEIEKAIANGNYRLATRLLFLRLLKMLATKNIIQYKQERTNLDYLMQLHSSNYYKDFFRLTRNYEYVWYGKFDPSAEIFTTIRNDFDDFDKKLN